MHQEVIKKIIKLGNSLPIVSGNIADVGKNQEWLTEKDSEIENQLVDIIKTFPGNPLIYAEHREPLLKSNTVFIQEKDIWVIDAISNTINFIHGVPHYSIVVSHLEKGNVTFAVVYDPSNKELFTAEKGKGAFLNNRRIYVSKRKKNIFFMIGPYLTPPRPYRNKAFKLIKVLSEKNNTLRIFGSLAIQYAYVACGRIDTAISFNEDTFPEFAGKLLVEEAGGKFSDFKGNMLNIKTKGVIASNGLIHNYIKNIISNIS